MSELIFPSDLNVYFQGDVFFRGTNFDLPDGSVIDDHLAAGENFDADKFQHRHVLSYGQLDGVDVAAETQLLYVARKAITLHSVELRVSTAPTGGDLKFTVDVQKASNGSNSWTSLLDSVITVDSSNVDHTLEAGTLIGSPTLSDGDALRVVVSTSGSTGSQGQGLVVAVNLDEDGS